MTAEPDLLPLPKVLAHWISLHAAHAADSADVRGFVEHYARANVAHATAARDAEVEALQAEVETRKEDYATLTEMWRADEAKYRDLAEQAEARAERLAEALRAFPAEPNPYTYRIAHAKARAALDQETTNG